MKNLLRRLFLFLICGTLIACGGGGSDSPPSPILTVFSPSAIEASYFQNQNTGVNTYAQQSALHVGVSLSPIPTGVIYATLTSDKPVFSKIEVDRYGINSTPQLVLTPILTLAPGTYTGTLTLKLFSDSMLTKQYALSASTIPFTITVSKQLTLTVKIDGVVQPAKLSNSQVAVSQINFNTVYWSPNDPVAAYTLKPGQIVEVEANMPVSWRSPQSFWPYGYLWSVPQLTETTLRQVVAAPPDGSPGMLGSQFIAMPATGTQWGTGFAIDIYP